MFVTQTAIGIDIPRAVCRWVWFCCPCLKSERESSKPFSLCQRHISYLNIQHQPKNNQPTNQPNWNRYNKNEIKRTHWYSVACWWRMANINFKVCEKWIAWSLMWFLWQFFSFIAVFTFVCGVFHHRARAREKQTRERECERDGERVYWAVIAALSVYAGAQMSLFMSERFNTQCRVRECMRMSRFQFRLAQIHKFISTQYMWYWCE